VVTAAVARQKGEAGRMQGAGGGKRIQFPHWAGRKYVKKVKESKKLKS